MAGMTQKRALKALFSLWSLSKHINNYFHQIYLSEKSDTENQLLY